ncbi:MAG: CoA transferase [Candidatus Bathyarchaeota archaeon]|nr:CoA transferase [Candidatus Bathyarchaeota archaeon]
MTSALQNIRIVDLTQHLAGPFCTMLLGDMGAKIFKVEPPWGDASRTSPQYPTIEGQNSYFMFVNRNKKSVVLDLKSDEGKKVLKELVKISDVVVENFRPGVMDRLNIGYEDLKQVNPGIIFASISGFGQDGPYVKRPSFDIIAQAMSGWMWLNSREKRGLNSQASMDPSCLAGSPGDTIPGLFCALSILAALQYRNTTGKGQRIDVAQTDSLMTVSGLSMMRTLYSDSTADERARQPSARIHGVYETKDGYVAIRVVGEKAINALAETIGVEADDVKPSSDFLINWFKKRNRSEVTNLLAEKIPLAPVQTDEELVIDPNVKERGMIVEKQHPAGFTYRTIASGIKFSETPTSIETLPPELGADTVEVLQSLGYTNKEIDKLIDVGVVRTAKS